MLVVERSSLVMLIVKHGLSEDPVALGKVLRVLT